MPSIWLGRDKYQFYKSLVSLDQGSKLLGLDSLISQYSLACLVTPTTNAVVKLQQLQSTPSHRWVGGANPPHIPKQDSGVIPNNTSIDALYNLYITTPWKSTSVAGLEDYPLWKQYSGITTCL